MKKAVIFIVEGATDKRALQNIFKKLYKHKEIHFEFTHGDITSDDYITTDNVEAKIYEFVDKYRKLKKLKTSDIFQIIQIFDTDGTYIDDSKIIKGPSNDFQYSLENIACNNIEKVKNRNMHKKKIMDYLVNCNSIKNIPYQCFYMSSNLDHALYDEQNLKDEDKAKLSRAFYEFFNGKENMFIKFLEMDVVNGVPDSYPASWRYIRENLNSLQRHTNLHIYFKQNPIL